MLANNIIRRSNYYANMLVFVNWLAINRRYSISFRALPGRQPRLHVKLIVEKPIKVNFGKYGSLSANDIINTSIRLAGSS